MVPAFFFSAYSEPCFPHPGPGANSRREDSAGEHVRAGEHGGRSSGGAAPDPGPRGR